DPAAAQADSIRAEIKSMNCFHIFTLLGGARQFRSSAGSVFKWRLFYFLQVSAYARYEAGKLDWNQLPPAFFPLIQTSATREVITKKVIWKPLGGRISPQLPSLKSRQTSSTLYSSDLQAWRRSVDESPVFVNVARTGLKGGSLNPWTSFPMVSLATKSTSFGLSYNARRSPICPAALRVVRKQTCPAPTGLQSTPQKFTSVRMTPPGLSSRRMPGFSPVMWTLPSDVIPVGC